MGAREEGVLGDEGCISHSEGPAERTVARSDRRRCTSARTAAATTLVGAWILLRVASRLMSCGCRRRASPTTRMLGRAEWAAVSLLRWISGLCHSGRARHQWAGG